MDYPGRERVEECARSFGELADIYYRMPCRKEGFGRQDIEDIFEELTGTVCRGCRSFGKCWKDQAAGTYQQLYEALTAMGEGKTEGDIRAGMSDACIRAGKMAGSMVWAFRNMRMKLYYANRLLEGREAVADQLWEMARLLDDMAEEMQRTGELKEPVNRRLCRLFDRRGAQVRKIFLMHKRKRRDELYITMHARKGECVPHSGSGGHFVCGAAPADGTGQKQPYRTGGRGRDRIVRGGNQVLPALRHQPGTQGRGTAVRGQFLLFSERPGRGGAESV